MTSRKRLLNQTPEKASSTNKQRKWTTSQLDRKRQQDREAQRASRAKTKDRINYLETLVESLQASSSNDNRVNKLLEQTQEQQAEIQRLRAIVGNISRLTEEFRTEKPLPKPLQEEKNIAVDDESFPALPSPSASPTIDGVDSLSFEYEILEASDTEFIQISRESPEITESPALPTPLSVPVSECTTDWKRQSITQTASCIANNMNLDGRLWYLAGGLLNHILVTSNSNVPITSAFDEDIAIRAVFEGWSAVIERYPLDRGWQWLKELDERIYFNTNEQNRLMHLRNSRLIFLRQTFPDKDWSDQIPSFFNARPAQTCLKHDPLLEHFPWPGFRERVLFSPLKYATNKFMDALRTYVDFYWDSEPIRLYKKDPLTGLYAYSNSLNERIMDIRCYGVKQEFLKLFPELSADVPCNSVALPRSLTAPNPGAWAGKGLLIDDHTEEEVSDRGFVKTYYLDDLNHIMAKS